MNGTFSRFAPNKYICTGNGGLLTINFQPREVGNWNIRGEVLYEPVISSNNKDEKNSCFYKKCSASAHVTIYGIENIPSFCIGDNFQLNLSTQETIIYDGSICIISTHQYTDKFSSKVSTIVDGITVPGFIGQFYDWASLQPELLSQSDRFMDDDFFM